MAGIIKSGIFAQRGGISESQVFNFEDMQERAEAYLEQVRQQGEAILADARAQAVELTRDAVDKLRQQAATEAEEKLDAYVAERLTTALPALQNAVDQIEQAKLSWIRHWEQETVKLAVAIAERIARRELQRQPEIPQTLIQESLQLAVGAGTYRLHLNPDDLEVLGSWIETLLSELGERAPSEVVADPAVTRGGCRVITEFGSIDQTFEAQLKRIEQELAS